MSDIGGIHTDVTMCACSARPLHPPNSMLGVLGRHGDWQHCFQQIEDSGLGKNWSAHSTLIIIFCFEGGAAGSLAAASPPYLLATICPTPVALGLCHMAAVRSAVV